MLGTANVMYVLRSRLGLLPAQTYPSLIQQQNHCAHSRYTKRLLAQFHTGRRSLLVSIHWHRCAIFFILFSLYSPHLLATTTLQLSSYSPHLLATTILISERHRSQITQQPSPDLHRRQLTSPDLHRRQLTSPDLHRRQLATVQWLQHR